MPNNEQSRWSIKVQEILQTCQGEIKRTTEIGKKMLSASKTNSHLHDAYEELGVLAAKAIQEKSLVWDDPQAKALLEQIGECERELKTLENEVDKIRFSEGPVDVSTRSQRTPPSNS